MRRLRPEGGVPLPEKTRATGGHPSPGARYHRRNPMSDHDARVRALAARLLAARPEDRVSATTLHPAVVEIALERPGHPTFRFHVHRSIDAITEFDVIKAVDDAGWSCC